MLDLRAKRVTVLPSSQGRFSPRWSPDGRYVAAMKLDQKELDMFDMRTKKWTELAHLDSLHNPVWSRDGTFLYFQADHEVIYRIRTSNRRLERVAGLENVKTSNVGPCFFVGLLTDDSPLFSCRRSDSDLYALELDEG
jgi:hypothetical protein